MKKHLCAANLCTAFLLIGCFTLRSYTVEQRDQIKDSQRIYKLKTIDGEIVRFDSVRGGFAVLRDALITMKK